MLALFRFGPVEASLPSTLPRRTSELHHSGKLSLTAGDLRLPSDGSRSSACFWLPGISRLVECRTRKAPEHLTRSQAS